MNKAQKIKINNNENENKDADDALKLKICEYHCHKLYVSAIFFNRYRHISVEYYSHSFHVI